MTTSPSEYKEIYQLCSSHGVISNCPCNIGPTTEENNRTKPVPQNGLNIISRLGVVRAGLHLSKIHPFEISYFTRPKF